MELFDRYINGEMTDEERQRFERRCEEDTSFAQEFAWYIQAFRASQEEAKATRKHEFADLYQATKTQRQTARTRVIRLRFAAAIAAAVALFILFRFIPFGSPSNEDLYAQYAQHELLAVSMGTADDTLTLAKQAFNNQDYPTAQPLLSAYLNTQTTPDSRLLLALGICQLETNQFETALITFQQLNALDLVDNDAPWYLALTYLRIGNNQQCLQYLDTTITNGGRHADQAQKLRKAVDSRQ